MKIKRLKIENFRGIVDDTIDFDPSFTVFAGRNGGGKSTILEAIAIMLSRISGRMSGRTGDCTSLRDRDITYGKDHCMLSLTISAPDDTITLTLGRDRRGGRICRKIARSVFKSGRSGLRASRFRILRFRQEHNELFCATSVRGGEQNGRI